MDPAALSEALSALFGDGTYELVEKMNPEGADLSAAAKRKKHEKRQAQVGLASNILGIAAGGQALYSSGHALRNKISEGKDKPKHKAEVAPKGPKVPDIAGFKGRLKPTASKGLLKNPKTGLYLAGGMVGLQAANLGGDLVANRVLSREAKKDIKKNVTLTPEAAARKKLYNQETDGLPMGARGQLVRISVRNQDKIKPYAQKAVDVAAPAARKSAVVAVETGKKAKDRFIAKADNMMIEGTISKSDSDKRQVFGWASIVEKDGVPVVDLQGDYISVDEVEKAAYEYVQKSRKGGNMHRRNGDEPHHVSDMIESFVLTPEKKEKLGMPESTPTGWWVGFQVHDEETWNEIKTGKRPAFSIHGRGKRQEL